MWLDLRNQPSKQTNLVDLQFLSNDALWCRILFKRNLIYESIFYNSTELTVMHSFPKTVVECC